MFWCYSVPSPVFRTKNLSMILMFDSKLNFVKKRQLIWEVSCFCGQLTIWPLQSIACSNCHITILQGRFNSNFHFWKKWKIEGCFKGVCFSPNGIWYFETKLVLNVKLLKLKNFNSYKGGSVCERGKVESDRESFWTGPRFSSWALPILLPFHFEHCIWSHSVS